MENLIRLKKVYSNVKTREKTVTIEELDHAITYGWTFADDDAEAQAGRLKKEAAEAAAKKKPVYGGGIPASKMAATKASVAHDKELVEKTRELVEAELAEEVEAAQREASALRDELETANDEITALKNASGNDSDFTELLEAEKQKRLKCEDDAKDARNKLSADLEKAKRKIRDLQVRLKK